MPLSRRRFNQSLLAALAAGLVPPQALSRGAPQELVEGRDWAALSPAQPGDSPGRIEVLEFFSYACGHCRDLHPLITAWEKRLPRDVAFRQAPVTFGRAAWANLARMHFALEAGGQLAGLQHAMFEAIHKHKVNLYTEKTSLDWLAKQGLDTGRFSETFRSFAVETRLARAEQLARAYRVDAVPTLAVDGRYVVLNQAARGLPDLLSITDALIVKARSTRKGKPGGAR